MQSVFLLEILSAATTLCGLILLATKSHNAPWAWLVLFISNTMWIAVGIRMALWGMVAQNMGLLITCSLGIWVWLIKPGLKNASPANLNIQITP